MMRAAPRYLAVVAATACVVAPAPGGRLSAQECRLPANVKVEKNQLSLPVSGGAERVTVIAGRDTSTWRRTADNRSLIAEVPLTRDLETETEYGLTVHVVRSPLPAELDQLQAVAGHVLAESRVLEASSLRGAIAARLARDCRTWTLPALDGVAAGDDWKRLVAARDSLERRRSEAGAAARGMALALAPAAPWRTPLRSLRDRASLPGAATAREIRRIDELLEAEPADTTAGTLPDLAARLDRLQDLLATWHARPPDSVAASAVNAARAPLPMLRRAVDSLTHLRTLIPPAHADSATATRQLAVAMRAGLAAPGSVIDHMAGTVELPAQDAGKLRVGLGLHYTAPLHEPIFGSPGAVNRIYPDLFLHWSPSPTGGRRPVTIDVGLALNTVGRRGEMRDLFWRSSLVLGVSVHPKGFVRFGGGVQLVREVTPEGRNKLRIPLYVGLSVVQFKL